MKKLVSLTLALLMALLALLPAMAEGPYTIRSGVLSMLNVNEAEMVNYKNARNLISIQLAKEGLLTHKVRQLHEKAGNKDMLNPIFEVVYFDTLDAALMALNARDIDCLEVYETVAQYLTHSDPGLVQVKTFSEDVDENAFARYVREGLLSNDFAFMFMEDNEALRDEFNAALASITGEEMDKLIQDNITAAINGDEIDPIQMPVIEGAQAVKVAVTGALPPMDYVAADGTPAGFNTALLAEISRRMGKNIELVVVDSVGRAAALASGAVDAVFWTRTSSKSNEIGNLSEEERARLQEADSQEQSEEERETIRQARELISFADYGRADMPEGTIITEPYFSDIIVSVTTQAKLDEEAALANQ